MSIISPKFFSPRDQQRYEKLISEANFPMPSLSSETTRLKHLSETKLFDSEPNDADYDRYTSMIARIFNVPYAFLYLVDMEEVYIKSSHGDFPYQLTRASPFISHYILDESADVEFIKHVDHDKRFDSYKQDPSHPTIGFYGVCPIHYMGSKIGILGMIDYVPRTEFTVDDRMNLLDIGITISSLISDHVASLSSNVNERASIMYEIIQGMHHNIEQLHYSSNRINELLLSSHVHTIKSIDRGDNELRRESIHVPKAMPDLIHGANHLHSILKSSLLIVESYFSKSVEFTPSSHTEISSLLLNQLSDSQVLEQKELYGNIEQVIDNVQTIVRGYLKINNYIDPDTNQKESESHSSDKIENIMSNGRIVDWDIDLDSINDHQSTQLFNSDLLRYSLLSIICGVLNDWNLVLIKVSYDNTVSFNSRLTSQVNSPARRQINSINQSYLQLERGKLLVDIHVFNPRVHTLHNTSKRSQFSVEPFLSEFGGYLSKSTIPLSDIPMRYAYTPTDDFDVSGVLYTLSIPCCMARNQPSILSSAQLCSIIAEQGIVSQLRAITSLSRASSSSYTQASQLKKIHVLVVDDSIATQKSFKSILRARGNCEVVVANHGKMGLEALQGRPFHVVFTDFLMPVMNGLDMLKAYAQLVPVSDSSRPVIIGMANKYSLNEMSLGYEYGLHGFIAHPIAINIITHIIDMIRKSIDADDAMHCLRKSHVLAGYSPMIPPSLNTVDSNDTYSSDQHSSGLTSIDSQSTTSGISPHDHATAKQMQTSSLSSSLLPYFNSSVKQVSFSSSKSTRLDDTIFTSVTISTMPDRHIDASSSVDDRHPMRAQTGSSSKRNSRILLPQL